MILTLNRKDAAGDASENAHPSGSRDPADAATAAGQSSRVDAQVGGATGAQAGAFTLKQRASENVSDEDKDKAHETARANKERTKNYLASKMTEERREQTIWRLKKLVVEIQGHPDCKSPPHSLLPVPHPKNVSKFAEHLPNVDINIDINHTHIRFPPIGSFKVTSYPLSTLFDVSKLVEHLHCIMYRDYFHPFPLS
jgi:hypothetical protein